MALSEEIKGISVKIGANTTELSTALKNINNEVKGTGTSLKEINRLLKLDPSNMELLTQKTKNLETAIEGSKNKIDALKQAQEEAKRMLADGEMDQGAYDQLSREIIAAEQNLQKLTNELDSTNAEMLKLNGAVEETGDSLKDETKETDKNNDAKRESSKVTDEASRSESKFADALKSAAVAAGAAVAAISAAAIKLGKDVVEAYADYEQLIGGIETLFETSDKAISNHVKNIGEQTAENLDATVWERLGEEVYKATGALKSFDNDVASDMDFVLDGLSQGLGTASEDLDEFSVYLGEFYGFNGEESEKMAQAISDAIRGNIDDLGDYANALNTVPDSTKMVAEYANQAFKTAGLSANEYMETVTSFSASLIQSLGGDTVRAAELANQAIIDMADNANKMGSDMSSIQNAYQGFAKQNYTMLDNLKLGYGGTQAEMFRLMSDAAALNEEFANTAVFSLDAKGHLEAGYADIVRAIHIVQTEMGITGTTAKEAEGTISGSISMTKSAWDNLIIGLGNPAADVQKLAQDVVASAQLVVNNVTPIIMNLISVLPMVFETLTSTMIELLPTLLETATSMFESVLEAIIEALPTLIPVVVQVIMTLVNTIIEHLPEILTAGITILITLASGIADAIPTLIPTVVQIFKVLILEIVNHLPEIITSGVDIIAALIVGLITAIPDIIKALPEIFVAIVNAFKEYDWASIGSDLMDGIKNGIVNAWDNIKKAVSDVAGKIKEKFKDIFGIESPSKWMRDNIGKNLDAGLAEGINRYKSLALNSVKDVSTAVSSAFLGNSLDYGSSKHYSNFAITTPVYLDGKVIATAVNERLGVML